MGLAASAASAAQAHDVADRQLELLAVQRLRTGKSSLL